jgi:hypothetical protein
MLEIKVVEINEIYVLCHMQTVVFMSRFLRKSVKLESSFGFKYLWQTQIKLNSLYNPTV